MQVRVADLTALDLQFQQVSKAPSVDAYGPQDCSSNPILAILADLLIW